VAFYGKAEHVNGAEPAIALRSSAAIAGNLSYYEDVTTSISNTAMVSGSTTVMTTKDATTLLPIENVLFQLSLWWTLWSVIAAMVIGVALISFWPRQTSIAVNDMVREPATNLAWGLLVMIITPFVITVLAITVIGLPLALVLALLLAAGWIIAPVIAAIAIGTWITRRFRWNIGKYWQMIIGIVVAYLIFATPLIGWIVWFIALLWGLGGLVKQCRVMHAATETPKR
jgi:hypothetical protein